jgi:class 3 adenylate cyclase
MNERLDYFGTTVNVAARLGGISSGDDIVISDAVRLDPEVERFFANNRAGLTSLSVDVKGIEGQMRVWRVVFADTLGS